MAVTTENFRSAFNGFHRGDVVQFIQRLTAEHERETRLLQEDTARLQKELAAAREQLTALQSTNEALISAAAQTAQQSEPAAPQTPAAAPERDWNELELAAYRRAEMTERMARERAAASAAQMRALFTQATTQLQLSEQDLDTLVSAFRSNYDQLLQTLAHTRQIMDESTAGLGSASAALCCEG